MPSSDLGVQKTLVLVQKDTLAFLCLNSLT